MLFKQKNFFKYESKRILTTFFNFVWDQNQKNIEALFDWSKLDKAKPYSPGSRICMLCLTEKYYFLFFEFKHLTVFLFYA